MLGVCEGHECNGGKCGLEEGEYPTCYNCPEGFEGDHCEIGTIF